MNDVTSLQAAPPGSDEIPLPRPDGRGERLGAIAKTYLQQACQRLQARHWAGASGGEIVAAYTEVVDRIVRYLFEAAVADFTSRNVRVSQTCAVLAQGGYGRGELNPASDLDLLFLYAWKVNPFVEHVAEKILYSLWDTGLQVSHAVRSVSECVRLAASDFKVKTALLDTRFLCGELTLYAEFDRAVKEHVLRRNPEKFFKDKVAFSEERHRRYGDSVYLLEPHIKEGEGGLRDLHTALWMARAKYKIDTLRELVHKGVVSERELESLLESRDFLWRARNTLHFLANNHQDQLTFEYQERVAQVLGYHDADERRAVERFMRDYYLHAGSVSRFANIMIDRCLERPGPVRRLGRMFGRRIRPGVRILDGEIAIEHPELLEKDPANLITIFVDAQRHGVAVGSRAKEWVRRQAPRLEAERESPAVIQAFLEVLRGRTRIHEALRGMHETGALGYLIPEFGQLRCMVIRDFYHIYTVDEHTLRGILELERLRAGEYRESCPLLTEVMREIDRPEVAFLAMLLHDVGKGHGHGHSDRGARLAESVARRFRLDEDDARQVERLVRHHLLMSHVAQHRDLQDDRVILSFAQHVGDAETLKKLYAMTFADIKAVGPTVWNNWRDLVLGELYLQSLDVFEKGTFVEEARESRAARRRERLRQAVLEREPALQARVEEALRTLPHSYLLFTPEESFRHHLDLLREFREGLGPLASSIRHFPEQEYSEFTVCTGDRPGLFSKITGVLTAHGLNILGAQITTSQDGVALDVFRVWHGESSSRVVEDERWNRVRETLERVLRGETSVESLVARSQRPSILARRNLPRIPTSVSFDNRDSEHYSLLEVSTQDGIGVLYAITYTLYQLGCLIHLAKISTVLHHVYDVFYITDSEGRKITDDWRTREIAEAVRARLEDRGAAGDGTGEATF